MHHLARQLSLRALACLLLVTGLHGSPLLPETESIDATTNPAEVVTLATELKPPRLDKKSSDEEQGQVVVYLINVFAVKNASAESSQEILDDGVVQNNPEIMEPLVSVLLVLEVNEDNTNDVTNAVDLSELADELKKEGFRVEEIQDGNETKLIRINLENEDVDDLISSTSRTKSNPDKIKEKKKKAKEEQLVRRKRTICIKCQNDPGYSGHGNYYPDNPGRYPSGGSVAVLPVIAVPIPIGGGKKHHHHHGGEDYYPPPNRGEYYPPSGGHRVPAYPQPRPPPVYPQPHPAPVYPQPHPVQPVYPQPGCNTCNGGGGGSSAHAEASASAHASSW